MLNPDHLTFRRSSGDAILPFDTWCNSRYGFEVTARHGCESIRRGTLSMKPGLVSVIAIAAVLAACKATAPGGVESKVLQEAKEVTIGGKDWKSPVSDTADAQKMGAEHFQHHCQICHGLDGQNTGVPFADKMSPPVANLASPDVQKYADGQLKWIIQNGIRLTGMPAWQGTLDEDEMWHIVLYIRHRPPKGSLGSPAIYREEAEEHAHEHEKEKKQK